MVVNMEASQIIIDALKFIFPAYCANAIPVITGGGYPIDLGKKFLDGKPIFGKNKTYLGFFSGLVIGTAIGIAESALFDYYILFGLLTSMGGLLGDLAGAFLKRRLGLAPGELLPIIDQVDFVIGAIFFSLLTSPPTMTIELAIAALIITPPIHLLMNFAAYKTGLKKNPW
jgi:CDP-2,3-bis-(O-geranylgeranyl)-sn-glycerol synthase